MRKLRILIVDDDRDFAESLGDLLRLNGHKVELASGAQEAVARFAEREFDLTFLDVRLPEKSGLTVLVKMRKLRPEALIVMVSAFGIEGLVEEAFDSGAWKVMRKPLDLARTLEMIASIDPGTLILIADDDEEFVASLKEILQHEGYRVRVAYDGEDALRRVRTDGFDALILDLRLPVMSGLEVYLGLMETGDTLPTIVITAYPLELADAIEELRSLSVSVVLAKPFGAEELLGPLKALTR